MAILFAYRNWAITKRKVLPQPTKIFFLFLKCGGNIIPHLVLHKESQTVLKCSVLSLLITCLLFVRKGEKSEDISLL